MSLPPGIYTPEEAAAAIEADAEEIADEYGALKRSVATLEAQVALLMNVALGKGDVSINAIRATLGLPDFALVGEIGPEK
jgi:hypothetical protein